MMRMLKLLIVDDESTTRNGLKKAFDWHALQIGDIREASNGQEALEILEHFEADIVLTDIRMPFMTGVELAKILVERYSSVKIIFLSAYSDKEYLKSAIRFGVVNYVEKPVDLDELKTAVLKAVQLCQQSQEVETMRQRSGISKKSMMENLIRNQQNHHEIQDQISLFEPKLLKQTNYVVLLFRVKKEADSNEIIRQLEQRLNDDVALKLSDERAMISSVKDDIHLISVFGWKEDKTYSKQLVELAEFVQEEFWKEKIYLAIGGEVTCLEEVYQSYQGAVIALQGLFMSGFGKVIKYRDELFNQNLNFNEDEILQEFRQVCWGLDNERILSYVRQFYQGIKLDKNYLTNELKNFSVNLYNELYKEAEKQRAFQKTEKMEEELRYHWEQIFNMETFDELRRYIEGKTVQLLNEIERCSRYTKTIRLVMELIEQHYMEADLSTNRLAAEVFLTDAYLSTSFKKEVGITISRYIQNLRMDKAKDFLRDRTLNIALISEKVGYMDPNYFAKTFRKVCGIAPSEFRERMW